MYHLLELNHTSFLLGLGLVAAALRAGNMKEITYKELLKLPLDSYTLVDTRDEGSTQYGTIPGSLHIEEEELKKEIESYALTLSPGKKLVLFCQNGIHTMALQEELEKRGRDAYSLEEGYVSYLRYGIENEKDEETREKAELFIRKKFHKELFTPFAKACNVFFLA